MCIILGWATPVCAFVGPYVCCLYISVSIGQLRCLRWIMGLTCVSYHFWWIMGLTCVSIASLMNNWAHMCIMSSLMNNGAGKCIHSTWDTRVSFPIVLAFACGGVLVGIFSLPALVILFSFISDGNRDGLVLAGLVGVLPFWLMGHWLGISLFGAKKTRILRDHFALHLFACYLRTRAVNN